MKCPSCANRVTKSSGDDLIVMTRYVKIGDDGKATFACKHCKEMLPMPAPARRVGIRKG